MKLRAIVAFSVGTGDDLCHDDIFGKDNPQENVPRGRSARAYRPARDPCCFGKSASRRTDRDGGLDSTRGSPGRSVDRPALAAGKIRFPRGVLGAERNTTRNPMLLLRFAGCVIVAVGRAAVPRIVVPGTAAQDTADDRGPGGDLSPSTGKTYPQTTAAASATCRRERRGPASRPDFFARPASSASPRHIRRSRCRSRRLMRTTLARGRSRWLGKTR